ncbi:hypothetical protein MRBLMI12_002475 [Microbacterium sp. LMI12-1-1.1]|uniref:hypothetical protein n=1 Tax=Microbacterium sp. LMI12-1-1.1 TaxID=3135225 RepID=UPI003440CED8
MDAPLGSGEFVEMDELERLRRRAYGPDADIAGDAEAEGRLAELEAARRRQLTNVDAAAEVPAQVGKPVAVAAPVDGPGADSTSILQPSDEAFAESLPGRGSVTEQDPRRRPVSNGTPAAPWWRRPRRLVILGAAIAALALIAGYVAGTSRLLAPVLTPPAESSTVQMPPVPDSFPQGLYLPSPHEILALRSVGEDADRPNDRHGVLESLGISPDELRRYQNFDGLNIWGGESRYGMACLFVAVPVQGIREGYSAEGCSPEGFDTIAELPQQGTDSVMRFVLGKDHVSVYVYERTADPRGSQG